MTDLSLFEKAVEFAREAYRGACAPFSDTPFFLYAAEKAAIASTMTGETGVLCAALLHDVLKVGKVSEETLSRAFPGRVYHLVLADQTDESFPEGSDWLSEKKKEIRAMWEKWDQGLRILVLSDRLASLRTADRLYLTEGDSVWNRYEEKDPYVRVEYCRELLLMLEPLKDTAAYKEFVSIFHRVFRR